MTIHVPGAVGNLSQCIDATRGNHADVGMPLSGIAEDVVDKLHDLAEVTESGVVGGNRSRFLF